MSALVIDTPLAPLVALVVKATLLTALAALAVLASRRLSAAARHWTITLAVCGLLGLPLLSGVLPSWTVLQVQAIAAPPAVQPDPPASTTSDAAPTSASVAASPASEPLLPARSPYTVWQVLALAYGSGAIVLLARLARQFAAARRLSRQSGAMDDQGWPSLLREGRAALGMRREVRLLRGTAETMPMALGAWQAAIVLPSVADEWSLDRRRAVLLHELAHVARRDCLTQLLAGVACAVYWPHPGVWWLARRLRVERELACDDLVLRAGTPPTDYAGHLLDVAYTLGGGHTNALAVGMARRSHLEGRMLAVLDAARNRALPGRRLRLAMAAVAMVAVVPLAVAPGSSEPQLMADVAPETELATAADANEQDAATARRILGPHLKPAPWSRAVESLVAQAAAELRGSGSWTISPSRTPGEVYLEMREGRSQSGRTVKLATLEGLGESQLSNGGPVKFVVRRDAGTFTFEGTARDGHGGGTFSFAASQSFPGELETRGVGRPTAEQQYEMARHDVGLELVDELQRRGYARATVTELVKAGHHGVRVDYVREMADLGYALGTLEPLITLRDHGVTPAFVRGLASHGFTKIPADEVRRVRDHGVTPEFIGELKALGFGNLALAEFVKIRDHGVTPQYVSAMRALGYTGESMDALVNARNHGVTPEFVKGLAELGYSALELQAIVRTRDHGVTPAYAREMHGLGYKAPLDALVKARDHGVTPDYARELKALGYDTLALDELITLRDHGVTADKARRANQRAGTKLPPDMLRSLASQGWR
jgi:beta-lactamase regulating signal transducer with metallopeptidase domain